MDIQKLAEQPVLVSDARPEVRVKMLESILDNNGYFGSRVSYSLKTERIRKRRRLYMTQNFLNHI